MAKEIIFTGRLTAERFQQIAAERGYTKPEQPNEENAAQNIKEPNEIFLKQAPDGNWLGYMEKRGEIIQVREIGPETALQKLLTHE